MRILNRRFLVLYLIIKGKWSQTLQFPFCTSIISKYKLCIKEIYNIAEPAIKLNDKVKDNAHTKVPIPNDETSGVYVIPFTD